MSKRIFIVILVFSSWVMNAQETNRNRYRKFVAVSDTVQLDTLSIFPEKITLLRGDKRIDTSLYHLVFSKKALVLDRRKMGKDSLAGDTFTCTFTTFPFDFSQSVFHKDAKSMQNGIYNTKNPYTIKYNPLANHQPSFISDGLTKNGSISRGVSFGNSQSVVVNSNLNLQVSGKLTKDIEMTLAATDNNIPIQPDGNSQQLQQFDKVFVQLNDKKSKLIVGDYQMQRPNSYFMSFYKRAQGIYFGNTSQLNNGAILKSTFSGALSRGQFNRMVFRGIENNQGPYQLTGSANEQFIVVLSGTERIFIDGRQLTRGQENEYVIDYNSAQITFTAKQIITKDKRITVEFQYSAKNYTRSLYYLNEDYQSGRMHLAFNYYDEQDNKNKPLQQTLSTNDRMLMYNIGDTLSKAYTNGWTPATFNTTDVFYKKIDSLITGSNPGNFQNIFVYTVNPSDTVYQVNFSYIGINQGNYYQDLSTSTNGKLFRWIEPLHGVPQGSYEPIIPLITPKKKQMATALAEYKTSENGMIGIEGAVTSNDVNTFSPYDKGQDNGQGVKAYYTETKVLNATDSGAIKNKFNYGGTYEFVNKNFSQIERFRSVEFFRDWNRNNDSIYADQHIAALNAGINLGNKLNTQYSGQSFTEGTRYQAFRNNLNTSFNLPNTKGFFNAALLNSKQGNMNTEFYRHKTKIIHRVNKLLLGYNDDFEHNKFTYVPTDSLLRKSYQFWEWEASVANADTTKNRIRLFYRERTDRFGYKTGLFNASHARNFGLTTDISTIKNHHIQATVIYRNLQITDTTLLPMKPDNNLLGRIEYSPRLFRGFIQGNVYYEVGYGLEQKKQYTYIQVPAGQGQYYWIDYNHDGIKQINEFEIAQYPDQMLFIRVYTPTTAYVKTAHDQFSASMYIRPSVFRTENSGKLMEFASRFVSQTAYRIDSKSYSSNQANPLSFNPFQVSLSDTNLMSFNSSLRQSLFFNQSNPKYGFDYTYQDNQGKQLLVSGYDARSLQSHELRTRWNVTRAWGIFTTSQIGTKGSASQLFQNRNYQVNMQETEPKLSYQPSTAFRISGIFKYTQKQNVAEGATQASKVYDYAVELKYNKLSKGSINARFDYLNISYNDMDNTPVAFEMLNALHPGQNVTWNVGFQQNLSNNLQISINYEGRKTPGYKVVHIGGAQVRAFF